MTQVPTVPSSQPALLKAFGIASTPVPKPALSKRNMVSRKLSNNVANKHP